MPEFSIERALNDRQQLIRIVGNRLFVTLLIALAIGMSWTFYVFGDGKVSAGAAPAVWFVGVLGGLIGLQNRLATLGEDDLLLLAKSITYLLLAPLVGGFLAILLYVLFISGLLEGDLFPNFSADPAEPAGSDTGGTASTGKEAATSDGISKIFHIHGNTPDDYAKLIFWSFLAGFSERFVTNIMGRFENSATSSVPASKGD